ncbi:MAG TPA: hypothetical protein VEL75_08205 [Candidatus Methylomirabilis sp.]|nr:hypothetical protein [Candidatus Methylomirabilis sp.]
MIASVTVFCGSSNAVEEKYFAAARELGAKFARRGWKLVYGADRSVSWACSPSPCAREAAT